MSGIRRWWSAVVAAAVVAAACTPIAARFDGSQSMALVMTGRHDWSANGDVPAPGFAIGLAADEALASVAGGFEFEGSSGDRLSVRIDVARLDGTLRGTIVVSNLASGDEVVGFVDMPSPRLDHGPLDLVATYGAIYDWAVEAGEIHISITTDGELPTTTAGPETTVGPSTTTTTTTTTAEPTSSTTSAPPQAELDGRSQLDPISVTSGESVAVELKVPVPFIAHDAIVAPEAPEWVRFTGILDGGGMVVVEVEPPAGIPATSLALEAVATTCSDEVCDTTGEWTIAVEIAVTDDVVDPAALGAFEADLDAFLAELRAEVAAGSREGGPVEAGRSPTSSAERQEPRRPVGASSGSAARTAALADVESCYQTVTADELSARYFNARSLSAADRFGVFDSFFLAHPGIVPTVDPKYRELGYGAGLRYFVDWLDESGRFDDKAVWWRTTDGMLALDLASAGELWSRCGRSARSELPGVQRWLAYISAPTQRRLWDAHQASLHYALDLLPTSLRRHPSSLEAQFANLVVQNVDYTALRNQRNSGDGWTRDYQAFLGMQVFLNFLYPSAYPAGKGDLEFHLDLIVSRLDIPFPPGRAHLGYLGEVDRIVRETATELASALAGGACSAVAGPSCAVALDMEPLIGNTLAWLDPLHQWLNPSWDEWTAYLMRQRLGIKARGWWHSNDNPIGGLTVSPSAPQTSGGYKFDVAGETGAYLYIQNNDYDGGREVFYSPGGTAEPRLLTSELRPDRYLIELAISPDGTAGVVLSGPYDGSSVELQLFDLVTGEETRSRTFTSNDSTDGADERPSNVSVSNRGAVVTWNVMGAYTGRSKIWHTETDRTTTLQTELDTESAGPGYIEEVCADASAVLLTNRHRQAFRFPMPQADVVVRPADHPAEFSREWVVERSVDSACEHGTVLDRVKLVWGGGSRTQFDIHDRAGVWSSIPLTARLGTAPAAALISDDQSFALAFVENPADVNWEVWRIPKDEDAALRLVAAIPRDRFDGFDDYSTNFAASNGAFAIKAWRSDGYGESDEFIIAGVAPA